MSREISFLETELFRLESEHTQATDAATRQHLVKQILKHCRRLGQIEAMGGGSDLIHPDEWFKRYSRPEASEATSAAAPVRSGVGSSGNADALFAGDFEGQINELSAEPYDPQRYEAKKSRIEAVMASVVQVRSASPSPNTLATVLARLWEIAVREDDAHETYLRTAQRG